MALMQQAQARVQPPPSGGPPPATSGPAPGAAVAPAAGPQDEGGGAFKPPDISKFIPPDQVDAVQRVAAAGMKMMYAPQMRQELMKEVQANKPVPQKLAEGVVGLMLTLDQHSQGGIPAAAIFPAAMELLGEAAQVLSAAGQQVTQQDYNDAARLMFVLIARKMGAQDQQIMGAAQKIAGGATQVAPDADAAQEGTEPAGAPDEQEQPA